jgi:hypothetical protein
MSDNQTLDTFDGLDYLEIEQAVMETSRGRWFLTEFARRHKAADTAELLDAIRRLEGQIQTMSAEASNSSVSQKLDGLEGLAELDEQPAADSDDDAGQPEIADKLDRTAKLVRRLRSSHKLISEAAEKPLRPPLPLSNARPRIATAGDPPGYVRSDDDIFADEKSAQAESQPQTDHVPEVAELATEVPNPSPVNGDTLNFAEFDLPDAEAVSQSEDAHVDTTADRSEIQSEEAPSSSRQGSSASSADNEKPVSGHIDMNSPAAANQGRKSEEPAAVSGQSTGEQPMEASSATPEDTEAAPKSKKRIIVIRRPADHPGDIPLAGSDAEINTENAPEI